MSRKLKTKKKQHWENGTVAFGRIHKKKTEKMLSPSHSEAAAQMLQRHLNFQKAPAVPIINVYIQQPGSHNQWRGKANSLNQRQSGKHKKAHLKLHATWSQLKRLYC